MYLYILRFKSEIFEILQILWLFHQYLMHFKLFVAPFKANSSVILKLSKVRNPVYSVITGILK